MIRHRLPWTLALLICLGCEPALGFFKCVDSNGRPVFSDRPCGEDAVRTDATGQHIRDLRTGAGRQSSVALDLVKQLGDPETAGNPLQAARSATVKIDTEAGNGSGFFVSERCHIVTNKHVVRPPAEMLEKASAELDEAEEYLRSVKRRLDRQRKPCSEYSNSDLCRTERARYREADIEVTRARLEFSRLTGRMASARSFDVVLKTGATQRATLLQLSQRFDLALLQIRDCRSPRLTSLETRPLRDAERVYVIGSPLGLADQISSGDFTGRQDGRLVTNAVVMPGNSGGPMVTEDGEVIGVVTVKVTAGEDATDESGLGVAIPISVVLREFEGLLAPD
jgi:serine protease Do